MVPPCVITRTLAVPSVPAGVIAVTVVALTTETLVAAVPPIVTLLAPVKLSPVIAKLVPPEAVPVDGETEDIVGGGFGFFIFTTLFVKLVTAMLRNLHTE